MFKNMKIGLRMGLGFGVVLFFMAVVISVALTKLKTVDDRLNRIVKINNVKVDCSNNMMNAVQDLDRVIRNMALETTTQGRLGEKKKLEDARSEYADQAKKLEGMLNSAEEKALYDKVAKLKEDTKVSNDRVVELFLAGKQAEGVTVLQNDSNVKTRELRDAIEALNNFQDKRSLVRYTEATAAYESAKIMMLTVGAIALIVGALIGFWITRTIVKPLTEAVDASNKLASGDLSFDIHVRSKDETGQLLEAMKNMLEKLREIVGEVKGAADNVAAGSQQLSSGSEEMSQGASEQAAAAEEASSSMEEMSSNIKQNADNALQTEKIAIKSAEDAKEGGAAVQETVNAMKEIAGKINIIEEIARQTNLLALNAAIEAARAGEHGKGFAVVAAEVRKLAERSQKAAAEISELSSNSVEVAVKAGELLTKMVPDIQKTAELVQEITAASREQDTGAEQINKAIQQLDQVIQQNASASEEMASTSEELASQAEQLQHSISFFKIENLVRKQTSLQPTIRKTAGKVAHIARAANANDKNKIANAKVAVNSDAGHVLDMDESNDQLDAAFERF